MPSPMTLRWPLTSFTNRTGPRLMPMRSRSRAASGRSRTPARRLLAAKSPSSGSPRKQRAAPSPVSRRSRSAAGVCSSAVARRVPNCAFISTCLETGSSEYRTMSTKTTVQMRFPDPRCAASIPPVSALDHLERLLQAPAHPVEGPAEHGDLVAPLLREFGDLEVPRAHLVGGPGHLRDGLDDQPAQHHVEDDEDDAEHDGERAQERVEG